MKFKYLQLFLIFLLTLSCNENSTGSVDTPVDAKSNIVGQWNVQFFRDSQ